MPAVAIETVIIIIVVISFAVLGAIIFSLYWLWRLLLEDRRCSRNFEREWQRQSALGHLEDGPQNALLGSRRGRNPRISRRREVFVDERCRRMVKAARCTESAIIPTNQASSDASTVTAAPLGPTRTDMVVLDVTYRGAVGWEVWNLWHHWVFIVCHYSQMHPKGTEPPPPYEETIR